MPYVKPKILPGAKLQYSTPKVVTVSSIGLSTAMAVGGTWIKK